MSDPTSILQAAIQRDRRQRMGLRVGTVVTATNGSAEVNFGRDTSVTVPGGGAYAGQNLLVLELDGVKLPIATAPVMMGSPFPEVESLP